MLEEKTNKAWCQDKEKTKQCEKINNKCDHPDLRIFLGGNIFYLLLAYLSSLMKCLFIKLKVF
jgi:hypothetical protein